MATQNSGTNRGKRGRVENLKPFQPGQSGNPGGRPKKTVLSDAYRAQLEKPYPRDRQGRTYAEVIAERLANEAAKKGSVYAASEIGDRTEGRPRQAVEVGGVNGAAINVNVREIPEDRLEAEIQTIVGSLGLAIGKSGRAKAKTPRAAKGKGKKAR